MLSFQKTGLKLYLNVGAARDEQADDVQMAVHHGEMQRRHATETCVTVGELKT